MGTGSCSVDCSSPCSQTAPLHVHIVVYSDPRGCGANREGVVSRSWHLHTNRSHILGKWTGGSGQRGGS